MDLTFIHRERTAFQRSGMLGSDDWSSWEGWAQARFPQFREGPGEGRVWRLPFPTPELDCLVTHTSESLTHSAIFFLSPFLSLSGSSAGFLMQSFGRGSADEELGGTCLEGSRCGGGRPEETGIACVWD